jgi:cell division protein FtsB
MTASRVRKAAPISQIALLLMAILFMYLIVDFGRQVGVSRQRREELRLLEMEVQAETAEIDKLVADLEFASSPEAVEAWARRRGMTRPGERLVVFFGGSLGEPSEVEQTATSRPGVESARDEWLDLFFGTR